MEAPPISNHVLRFFRFIVRGYFRRHFRAVRLSNAGVLDRLGPGPLIVYANHSSWWDPMISVLLAAERLPGRRHYAPMDAQALGRYGILQKIGVFPVELQSARGAAQFIRTGLSVLQHAGVLWITPQGRFADPREEPLVFKPGMAALAARVSGGCTVLPLAIEYTFWNERLPEALLHFGEPITVHAQSADELNLLFNERLAGTMAGLREKSIARDPTGFELVQQGRVGTGGFYQLGQSFWTRLRGRRFRPEHAPVAEAQSRRG